ncbi:uncharacterized protein LOC124478078 [Hypomesus transpacificus]|uniref:uncharacterized protein LOC124478078 n=1 Tax=Hypomesus transpacificus TaxID=137520 RepID=UPI001F071353|nr:uncharacterized protein LOC124478078 [Hypomesus transpacificus]
MVGIMTVIKVFLIICVIQRNKSQRQTQVTKVQLGDPTSLYCVLSEQEFDQGFFLWFKQTIGETPQAIARMLKHQEVPEYYDKYNNKHLKVEKSEKDMSYRLLLNETRQTDEAIYYCAVIEGYDMHLKNGTLLIIEGTNQHLSDYQTVLQQPKSEPVHPGDSVTLQCSVLSESCTGQHSVFWFRAGAGESHPGLLYTQGNRSEECEKRPETPSPTRSCVYSLSKNNLSSSDSGTYYCAVATCGEILFGNGTRLDVEPAVDLIVIVQGLSLAVCVVLIIILICTRKTRTVCENCKVSVTCHGHDRTTAERSRGQEGEDLNYAALQFSEMKGKRGRRKRETPQESVYSDVRGSDWEGSGL